MIGGLRVATLERGALEAASRLPLLAEGPPLVMDQYVTIDEALTVIGEFGWGQVTQFVLVSFKIPDCLRTERCDRVKLFTSQMPSDALTGMRPAAGHRSLDSSR